MEVHHKLHELFLVNSAGIRLKGEFELWASDLHIFFLSFEHLSEHLELFLKNRIELDLFLHI